MTICEFREVHNMTQAELAKWVTLPTGKHLHRAAVSHYETGRRAPTAMWRGVAEAIVSATYTIAWTSLRRRPKPSEYVTLPDLVRIIEAGERDLYEAKKRRAT